MPSQKVQPLPWGESPMYAKVEGEVVEVAEVGTLRVVEVVAVLAGGP